MSSRCLLALVLLACGEPRGAPAVGPPTVRRAPAPVAPALAPAPSSPVPQPADPPAAPETAAEDVIFADAPAERAARAVACPTGRPDADRTRCLLELAFRDDPRAAGMAVELFERHGVLAGVDVDHVMDGGYRGMLHLVPERPVGRDRRHLEWLRDAARDFDAFFAGLDPAGDRLRYRWRPLALRTMRSVRARTPSAYAIDWQVAYNLSGSLHTSGRRVRETMFHEIFHLNDAAHGVWSPGALGPTFDSIVDRCGTSVPCLRPYTPNSTVVRGGTYYSFQPGNGVQEYAAELALRYYREQRAVLRSERGERPFKCGPAQNARAWDLLVREFFGGIDRTARCPG